uniref:Retrovirus-related Pol polyprotein from transposon TNT 1-94 n=1 Tax=Rhizophora mucronata TaxID=61149 RepID=A0A2P2JZB8_RHIMU
MQLLNLRRKFELLRMKDTNTIKEYGDKLLKLVNQIRVLGEDFLNRNIVQKVLVSMPERFEVKISSLEDLKDLNTISLPELLNSLQAQGQRRLLRQEENIEGVFFMKQ